MQVGGFSRGCSHVCFVLSSEARTRLFAAWGPGSGGEGAGGLVGEVRLTYHLATVVDACEQVARERKTLALIHF